MGKAGRWLRSFLAGGKKGGKKGEAMAAALPGEAAKEKRWSFRRPVHGEKAAAEEEEEYTFEGFADELVALMEEMGVSGAVYVGHSMAGMIGCIASINRPGLFTHLVLVGASPR
jgi:pimeloyl-ACP methyl ester carboxylesterase